MVFIHLLADRRKQGIQLAVDVLQVMIHADLLILLLGLSIRVWIRIVIISIALICNIERLGRVSAEE